MRKLYLIALLSISNAIMSSEITGNGRVVVSGRGNVVVSGNGTRTISDSYGNVVTGGSDNVIVVNGRQFVNGQRVDESEVAVNASMDLENTIYRRRELVPVSHYKPSNSGDGIPVFDGNGNAVAFDSYVIEVPNMDDSGLTTAELVASRVRQSRLRTSELSKAELIDYGRELTDVRTCQYMEECAARNGGRGDWEGFSHTSPKDMSGMAEACMAYKTHQDRTFDRERLLKDINAWGRHTGTLENFNDREKLEELANDLNDVKASVALRALRACRANGNLRCVGEVLEGPHGDTYMYDPDTNTIHSKNAPLEEFGNARRMFSLVGCDKDQNCTTGLGDLSGGGKIAKTFRELISTSKDLQDAKEAEESGLTHGEFQALRKAGARVLIGSNDASEQSNGQLFVRFKVDDANTEFPVFQATLRKEMEMHPDNTEYRHLNGRTSCLVRDRIANCTVNLGQRREREQCDSSLSSNFSVRDNLLVDSTFRTQLLAAAGRDSSNLSLDEVKARLGN